MLNDLRSAVRGLRREPGATFLIVLTLALGVGANTAIFSIVNGVLLKPLDFQSPERIVVIQELSGRGTVVGNAPANFLDLTRRSRSFEALAAIREDTFELTGEREPAHLDGAHVTTQFFDVFGVSPLRGRTFRHGDDVRGDEGRVVLSYDAWQGQFGADPKIIGRIVHLNGHAYVVTGVMPPGFRHGADLRVWTLATDGVPPSPIEIDGPLSENREVRYFDVLGRLKRSVSLETGRADATSVAKAIAQAHPQTSEGLDYRVRTLHEFTVGDVRFALLVLLASVGLVLLIACANIASLLLARATARQREVAVRSALGASPGQIARLFLIESLVFAILGGGLAIAVAAWSLDALRSLAATAVPRAESITLDYRVGLFTAVLTLLSALIFGLAPLGLVRRLGLHEAIKATARSGGSRATSRLRQVLVVGEISLAVVLLVGAGLMVRSLWALLSVDVGVKTAGVTAAMLPLPANRYPTLAQQADAYHRVLEKVRQHPGVSAAAVGFPLPSQSKGSSASFNIEGQPTTTRANRPTALFNAVSPGYFRTLGVPLLRGRDFQESDRENGMAVVIVTQAFTKRYLPGNQDPIGRRLLFGNGDPATIVGVVADYRRDSLDQPPEPMFFMPYRQFSLPFMTVVVRSTAPHAAVTTLIRQEMREIDRDLALAEVTTLDETRGKTIAQPTFRAKALVLFGGLALLLASIGVYGLLSQSVAQRTRELGVRIAVGAAPADVYRLVIGEGLRLTGIGLAAGVLMALLASKAISALLFGIAPTDVATFAAVIGTLVAVAIAASYLPARRAMRVSPIEALRSE
jgi:putative ABC transport system permease protein